MISTQQRATFLRLMEQFEPALRRLSSAYFERGPDREDLFQEIAVALWQAIPNFRAESSERTWLYRIAHNVAISSSAKRRRIGHREQHVSDSFDSPSLSSGAYQDVLSQERRKLLIHAIRGLPMVDRQVVLLHLEDLSHTEIAEVTALSQNAIATRLTRIREKLKTLIQGKEAPDEESRSIA